MFSWFSQYKSKSEAESHFHETTHQDPHLSSVFLNGNYVWVFLRKMSAAELISLCVAVPILVLSQCCLPFHRKFISIFCITWKFMIRLLTASPLLTSRGFLLGYHKDKAFWRKRRSIVGNRAAQREKILYFRHLYCVLLPWSKFCMKRRTETPRALNS